MKINVHVKEKIIPVQCGNGPQRLKWLGHVGIARYDTGNNGELGVPLGIRNDKELFNMELIIKDTLQDEDSVYVVLKGDTIPEEVTKRYIPPPAKPKVIPEQLSSSSSSSSSSSAPAADPAVAASTPDASSPLSSSSSSTTSTTTSTSDATVASPPASDAATSPPDNA